MAAQTATRAPTGLGDAIAAFALDGHFPDEDLSSLALPSADLSSAIEALAKAKSQLESEVHTINEETKGDVSSWVTNAKTLQEDILRSKRLADDIVRQSEAPDVSGKAIDDAEEHISFLQKEVAYSNQLHEALKGIRHVNEILSEVEQAMHERRILDALRWLEKSWAELDKVPVSKKGARVMRLLDVRAFELKSAVHDVFDHVWHALVHVNCEAGKVSIYNQREDEPMTLSEAIIGLEAYKEVDDRMSRLWQDIDRAIVFPRMDAEAMTRPAVSVNENMLQTQGDAGDSIDDLFTDLQTIIEFLAQRLPPDLLIYLSPIMMNDVVPRLVNVWLDRAVPSSLQDIHQFKAVIQSAEAFCDSLEQHGFSGFSELKEWVGNAPSIWLAKCRETALDAVRRQLSQGLGAPRQVEKVEKQMISRSEGKELTANANAVATQANVEDDWGAAWGADDDLPQPQDEGPERPEAAGHPKPSDAKADTVDDDGTDAWGWDDDTQGANDQSETAAPKGNEDDEDDAAAAWGWGDEEDTGASGPQSSPAAKKSRQPTAPDAEESREMVLRETYHISSLPEPVLTLIEAILEDGAALTQASNETNPVASAAAGLFSLPTFALAMFRAVSPYYYALDMGGNMFLYNDAMYMAEKLGDVAERWKSRDDLTPRARSMLRIDNDIKGLQGFANRAYTDELGVQKTVIRDLLGGEQSLMQQDEMEASVDAAVARVRSMAVTWETILARSVWYQAVGSLVDALSQKMIADVTDMSSIGQDEAYRIAQQIAKATELDDLFRPSRGGGGGGAGQQGGEDEVPATAQYAATWLRLQYLSEVLQSNLNEVKYLWCEGELSLYFSVEEVVDLIEASFEANARTKETIREIRDRPQPVQL